MNSFLAWAIMGFLYALVIVVFMALISSALNETWGAVEVGLLTSGKL